MKPNRTLTILGVCLVITAGILLSCGPPPNYTLITSCTPPQGGTISPSDGTYQAKTQVTLIATPAQYYKFDECGGDVSGTANPLTIKMNSNRTIVAQFSPIIYSIQVQSNPADGGSMHPDSGTYAAGTTVPLTATPSIGYRFDHWGPDASWGSANPLSLLVDSNKVVTAYFIRQYKLSVSANPICLTVSPNGGTYDAGKTVPLTATPLFPYAFKNWVGTDNDNINPTTVTMNADKSVSVNCVQETKKTSGDGGKQICNGVDTVPIDLNQGEWVEGTINCGNFPQLHVYIESPDGTTLKDFGDLGQTDFRIMAPVTGTYSIVVQANFLYCGGYTYAYTVYGLP